MARVKIVGSKLVFVNGSRSCCIDANKGTVQVNMGRAFRQYGVEKVFIKETGLTIKQFFRAYVRTNFPRRCSACKSKIRSTINGYPDGSMISCACFKRTIQEPYYGE
jgi:hypothetical protein